MHESNIFSALKPECVTDPECPDHLACIRQKCQNPCFTTTCGVNAECRVKKHRAVCICNPGLIGDPYRICEERKIISGYHEKSRITLKLLLFLIISGMQEWWWVHLDTGLYPKRMSGSLSIWAMWDKSFLHSQSRSTTFSIVSRAWLASTMT